MPSLASSLSLASPRFVGGGFAGALDAYAPDLFECWSAARRLLASYSGPLVRLRRSSDSAESDFGFDGDGELDVAAITTWKGAASLYLVTLYGQKDVADMTQATAGTQPPFNTSGAAGTSKPYWGDGNDTKSVETAAFANYTGADHTWGAVGDPVALFRTFASAKNTGATRSDFLGAAGTAATSAVRINGSYVTNTITGTWRVSTMRKSGNGASNSRFLSNDIGPTTGTLGSSMDVVCYTGGTRKTAEIFAAHAAMSTAAQDAIHAEMRSYYGL